MNRSSSIKNLVKDALGNRLSAMHNAYAKAVITASICWGGVNLMTVNSTYIRNMPNQDKNLCDTVIVDTVSCQDSCSDSCSDSAKLDGAKSLDQMISSYARHDAIFMDNDYYRMLRENDALSQIQKYDIKTESTMMLVNKTFQKAMLVQLEMQSYIYSKDSLDSFIRQGRKFKISRNYPDKIVEMRLEPTILIEKDCSTAKTYGDKKQDGDSKTPEGMFTVYSVEDSHGWTYDGAWAFGPKFLRIKNAIGVHGNGTDTLNNKAENKYLIKDKRYMTPGPLGIYANNFGVGQSHGCVRLDNAVIDEWIRDGVLKNGTNIIIFENRELTKTLSRYYALPVSRQRISRQYIFPITLKKLSVSKLSTVSELSVY